MIHRFEDVRIIIGGGNVARDAVVEPSAILEGDGDRIPNLERSEAIEDAGYRLAAAGLPVHVAGKHGVAALPWSGAEVVPGHLIRPLGHLRVAVCAKPHCDYRGVDVEPWDGH